MNSVKEILVEFGKGCSVGKAGECEECLDAAVSAIKAQGSWQPIETAQRKRGMRVIGWCTFPAGAEAREVKCHVPLNEPSAKPTWFYGSIVQTVTHWMPLPAPPDSA